MVLKPNELKAIAWYMERHNLRLQLSRPPEIFFLNQDGNEIIKQIDWLVRDWESWRKEEKRNKGS